MSLAGQASLDKLLCLPYIMRYLMTFNLQWYSEFLIGLNSSEYSVVETQ